MTRFSISVTTIREVVLEAKTPAEARKKAARYARDVMPSIALPKLSTPIPRKPNYTSRTSDDADEIPRDD